MKYFIDTEFLEGPQKEKFPISLFRKQTPNTIDLISIGIVSEDEREYYAISKDFNLEEAWNRFEWKHDLGEEPVKVYWLREKVLNPIFMEFQDLEREYLEKQKRIVGYAPCINSEFCYCNFKRLLKKYGKTNKEITEEIVKFCEYRTQHEISLGRILHSSHSKKPEFYAYYADYDWVVFCWLFGKMIDLPKGFPMYCKDLKQIFDEKEDWLKLQDMELPISLKQHTSYPVQNPLKSHNAIEDARWNKQFYKFLNKV